ncbi:MAG: type II toxin-antitoxin system VapC family toxin [Deltaproteobacteria bacterium]|nr:type II toxin-antitoxin system VapC family toxin [Deltaproteobacteria bacterium]
MEREAFMKECVLDTSVVLKWFSGFGENDLDQALRLRQNLLDRSILFVIPELLFYELANALRYNPNFSAKDVNEALDSVFDMGLEVRRADKKVMEDAITIGFKFNIPVYDAYFVALSRIEGKPLITADYKFVERMKGTKGIIKLSDI